MRRQGWDDVQPLLLVHGWCCRAWPETQELILATAAGRWNSFHVLGSPPCVHMYLSRGQDISKMPGLTCLGSVLRAGVTVEFSWLFGQQVPLSFPVSAAPAVLEVPCSRLEGCGEIL